MGRMRDAVEMVDAPLSVSVYSPPGAHEPKAERAFSAAATLLKGVLQDIFCTTGEYSLRPCRRIKPNAKWSRVTVRGESPHNKDQSFHVRICPGDTESAWEYILTTPRGVSAATLQEQLVSFDRRCRAIAVLNPEKQNDEMDFMAHAKVAELSPVEKPQASPESLPQPPADLEPCTSQPVSPALKSIDDLFQRMRKAVLRKEGRDSRSKGINRAIDAERKKIIEAEARIVGLENELLAIMQEDEGDREYKEAEALVGTIKMLTSPGQVA